MDKTVKGIKKTLKRLQKLGDDAEKMVDQTTEGAVTEIALDATSRAPVDSGDLQQGIIPRKAGHLTYEVVVTELYGAYVEFGTGAKVSVPAEMQDLATKIRNNPKGSYDDAIISIQDWLKRKGEPSTEKDAKRVFFLVIRNGITPQPFLYPAFVQGREQYLKDLKALLKKLTK